MANDLNTSGVLCSGRKGEEEKRGGEDFFFFNSKGCQVGSLFFLKFFRIPLRGIHVFYHMFRGILKNILIKQVAVISEAVC